MMQPVHLFKEINQDPERAIYKNINEAVIAKDLLAIRLFTQNRNNLFWQDPETGDTAFHLAAQQEDTKVLSELLQGVIFAGELDKPNKEGCTALHEAAKIDNSDAFELLVKAGANQYKSFYDKLTTPLHTAARHGSCKIIKLYPSCSVNRLAQDNFTPLHLASFAGKIDACRLLLERGANPRLQTKAHKLTVLHFAARYGHVDIIPLFANWKTQIIDIKTSWGATAFYVACEHGNIEACRKLHLLGATPTKEPNCPLEIAAKNGHESIVEFFIETLKYTEEQADKSKVVYIAAKNGHASIVRRLLAAGADTSYRDKYNCTALHEAAYYGHVDCIRALCQNSTEDLNARDTDGLTPFYHACDRGQDKAAAVLLYFGACINPVVKENTWTPLMHAAADGHCQIIPLFSQRVDLIDKRLENGLSALEVAALHGHPDFVQGLLDHGASIRALQPAAISCPRKVIDVFISYMQKRLQPLCKAVKDPSNYEQVLDGIADMLFLQDRFSDALKINSVKLDILMQVSAQIPIEQFDRAYQRLPRHTNQDLSKISFTKEASILIQSIAQHQLRTLDSICQQLAHRKNHQCYELLQTLRELIEDFSLTSLHEFIAQTRKLKEKLTAVKEVAPLVDAFCAINEMIYTKLSAIPTYIPPYELSVPSYQLTTAQFEQTSILEILTNRYGLYNKELSTKSYIKAGLLRGEDLRLIGIDNSFYESNPANLQLGLKDRISKLQRWNIHFPEHKQRILHAIDCLQSILAEVQKEPTADTLLEQMSKLSLTNTSFYEADQRSALLLLEFFIISKSDHIDHLLAKSETTSLSEYVYKTGKDIL